MFRDRNIIINNQFPKQRVGTLSASFYIYMTASIYTPQFALLRLIDNTGKVQASATRSSKHAHTITELITDFLQAYCLNNKWGIFYNSDEDYQDFLDRTLVDFTPEDKRVMRLDTEPRIFCYYYVHLIVHWANTQITQEYCVRLEKKPEIVINLIGGKTIEIHQEEVKNVMVNGLPYQFFTNQ